MKHQALLHGGNSRASPRFIAAAQSIASRNKPCPRSRTKLAGLDPRWPQVRHMNAIPANLDGKDEAELGTYSEAHHEHAVISTFDLFSIGIGPSSSHTVGPMRAGNIFVADLLEAGLLQKVHKIRVSIYGSLALTGGGHMTPSALLLGLESADVETVDTAYVPLRFEEIKTINKLHLGHGLANGNGKEIDFDYKKDFTWEWGRKLALHSNGIRITVFDEDGTMLATNDLFSVGGGFVVNGALSIERNVTKASIGSGAVGANSSAIEPKSESAGAHPADLEENMFYKEIRRSDAAGDRKLGSEIKPLDVSDTTDSMTLPGPDLGTSDALSSSDSGGVAAADIDTASGSSSSGSKHPRYLFRDAQSLLNLCNKHNLTIAQLVYENEKSLGYSDEEIFHKLFRIWEVMDDSIQQGVQAPLDSVLPGSLKLRRRAPALYQRLTRGLYPSSTRNTTAESSPRSLPSQESNSNEISSKEVSALQNSLTSRQQLALKRQPVRTLGSFNHPISPSPVRRTTFPAMDYLTVYAIAVNETNAAGGRIVTAPTNGAAGIIPAVLKYMLEFISDDPERDIATFLLTAAAIGMLYKRGATISAAEGGCMAEVGVATSMSSGAFAAVLGATPEAIEQAAEIGIEHNLGLTCDPIHGLVQAPCIERNALGAIKAISSANLALSSETGTQKVRLDDAIRAMRVTAEGMRHEFKETSLSGLATSVPLNIPVSVPDC